MNGTQRSKDSNSSTAFIMTNEAFFLHAKRKTKNVMKILLHICCAPCAIYPVQVLTGGEHYVHGFFYNPNIHPYQEFARRAAAL